jgi:hypothetical protein
MRWTIIGAVAISAAIAAVGGVAAGIVALAIIGWLVLACRPTEAGAFVATLSRQRFE